MKNFKTAKAEARFQIQRRKLEKSQNKIERTTLMTRQVTIGK